MPEPYTPHEMDIRRRFGERERQFQHVDIEYLLRALDAKRQRAGIAEDKLSFYESAGFPAPHDAVEWRQRAERAEAQVERLRELLRRAETIIGWRVIVPPSLPEDDPHAKCSPRAPCGQYPLEEATEPCLAEKP